MTDPREVILGLFHFVDFLPYNVTLSGPAEAARLELRGASMAWLDADAVAKGQPIAAPKLVGDHA